MKSKKIRQLVKKRSYNLSRKKLCNLSEGDAAHRKILGKL
jgi:hypothetical protein